MRVLVAQDLPTRAEQERIVALLRNYAAAYKPDEAFDEQITFFTGNAKKDEWHKKYSLYTNRFVRDWQEYWRPASEDFRPKRQKWRKGHNPLGDGQPKDGFMALADGSAEFKWNRAAFLRNHRCAVLDYFVERDHSRWFIEDTKNTTAYGGTIYVDAETGKILRETEAGPQVPAHYQAHHIWSQTDYDEVKIGDVQLTVPIETIEITTSHGKTSRVVWNWYNYRPFDVSSAVSFGN